MQEEPLLLTQRDRDRLKVLHEVRKGHITQRQAGEQLKLTEHWIRELVERIRQKGDRAVIHKQRGQPSTLDCCGYGATSTQIAAPSKEYASPMLIVRFELNRPPQAGVPDGTGGTTKFI